MSPDDYTSDPDPTSSGVPGTVDDVPADYGEDLSVASDAAAAEPSVVDTAEESQAAGGDEGELWGHQKALIEEDEKEGLKLESFPAEEIPDILEAMGDDAADSLVDSPNGTSATGFWGGPDHGGFPPRKD
jgi:hypothetical protein